MYEKIERLLNSSKNHFQIRSAVLSCGVVAVGNVRIKVEDFLNIDRVRRSTRFLEIIFVLSLDKNYALTTHSCLYFEQELCFYDSEHVKVSSLKLSLERLFKVTDYLFRVKNC